MHNNVSCIQHCAQHIATLELSPKCQWEDNLYFLLISLLINQNDHSQQTCSADAFLLEPAEYCSELFTVLLMALVSGAFTLFTGAVFAEHFFGLVTLETSDKLQKRRDNQSSRLNSFNRSKQRHMHTTEYMKRNWLDNGTLNKFISAKEA